MNRILALASLTLGFWGCLLIATPVRAVAIGQDGIAVNEKYNKCSGYRDNGQALPAGDVSGGSSYWEAYYPDNHVVNTIFTRLGACIFKNDPLTVADAQACCTGLGLTYIRESSAIPSGANEYFDTILIDYSQKKCALVSYSDLSRAKVDTQNPGIYKDTTYTQSSWIDYSIDDRPIRVSKQTSNGSSITFSGRGICRYGSGRADKYKVCCEQLGYDYIGELPQGYTSNWVAKTSNAISYTPSKYILVGERTEAECKLLPISYGHRWCGGRCEPVTETPCTEADCKSLPASYGYEWCITSGRCQKTAEVTCVKPTITATTQVQTTTTPPVTTPPVTTTPITTTTVNPPVTNTTSTTAQGTIEIVTPKIIEAPKLVAVKALLNSKYKNVSGKILVDAKNESGRYISGFMTYNSGGKVKKNIFVSYLQKVNGKESWKLLFVVPSTVNCNSLNKYYLPKSLLKGLCVEKKTAPQATTY